MKILMIDDNERDMEQFCDEVKLYDVEIDHAHNIDELKEFINIESKKYNGIILDLMFPPVGEINADLTHSGFLAGIFLYEQFINPKFKNIPFVVYSAIDESTKFHRIAVEKLSKYSEYKGFFQKPSDTKDIINTLKQGGG
jgi:hypothetical protein